MPKKLRSPVLNDVFEHFITAIKADAEIGEQIAVCIQDVINKGENTKSEKWDEAVFPKVKAPENAAS